MSRGDVYLLARKVAFYERRQGVKVDRTIIITPMLDPRAQPVANALGIQVYTDDPNLSRSQSLAADCVQRGQ